MDSHIGPDHACGRVHILLVPEAKRDAVRPHAGEHDRKGKGEALS